MQATTIVAAPIGLSICAAAQTACRDPFDGAKRRMGFAANVPEQGGLAGSRRALY